MLRLLFELIRKDLRIFTADRRSVMISFLTPVILACFIGYLMGSTGKSDQPKAVSVFVVDQDKSDFSKNLISRLKTGNALKVEEVDEPTAKTKVSGGDMALAIVIPAEFGVQAKMAMLKHTDQPSYRFLTDPSRSIEVAMAKGALMKSTMQALTQTVFGTATDPDASNLPFKISEESQTVPNGAATSGAAHAFAGMSMQGLLFWAIESAMTLLREKRMGIWRRLRSSPVSPTMFLLGRGISAAIRALAIVLVVFGVGFAVFRFSITPSVENYIGFGLIAICSAIMASTFGLFVAALGKNEQQSRGLSILAVLGMCMLGGAWFPMFLMPQIMQTISKAIPISWAVNGFDGMIWRGQGFSDAITACAVLLAFSIVFGFVALRRISWEPEAG